MTIIATPREGPTAGEPAPAFQQKIGAFDGTMLVVGTIIGSGIFIVSADIARDVGTAGWLLAVWVLTGVMTIMGALSYAELAAMMPHAGGQYVFLRESYSPLWGFLYGWTCFLVIQTGSIAAVGVAFAKYLGVLVPQLGVDAAAGATILYHVKFLKPINLTLHLPWMSEALTVYHREDFTITAGHAVAVAIVMTLSLVNCLGVREGKWVQNVFTVAKTLGLLTLIVVGLTVAANARAISANTSDLWQGITQTAQFEKVRQLAGLGTAVVALMVVGGAMVGSLFSADAWNNLTFTATEVKDPRRNLPRCLAWGTGIVITLYLLANLAYLAALPVQGNEAEARALEAEGKDAEAVLARGIDHAKDDRVASAVFARVSPHFGVIFISLAVMISTFGSINGMILMGARLYYAMARDGLFFQSVGQLNRRGVPAAGLVLQGLWSAALVFSGTYSDLLDYVIFAALLFYVLTVVGLFILRYKLPVAERPYRVIGYPVMPAVYVFLCLVIMLDLLVVKPVYTWPGLIIVLSGIPIYFLWRLTVRPSKKPEA
jgi:APA family basic amino acid/polyamine antiporter